MIDTLGRVCVVTCTEYPKNRIESVEVVIRISPNCAIGVVITDYG